MDESMNAAVKQVAEIVYGAIHEPSWTSAFVEVVYYPDTTDFSGDVVRPDGRLIAIELGFDFLDAFDELRLLFRKSGQPMWGRARMDLMPHGKFTMQWGYDACDANGDTLWNPDAWRVRQEEILRRRGVH